MKFRFQEVSEKRIPIMLCANKTDLRDKLVKDGRTCVTTEQVNNIYFLFLKKWVKPGLFLLYFCFFFHIPIQVTNIQFELYKLKKA